VKFPKIQTLIALVEALQRHPVGASYLVVLVTLVGAFSIMFVHR
jgi:hypothetical protein